MKAWVSQLYKAGKPVPRDKQPTVVEGDLNVADGMHPVLNRLVSEACLLGNGGTHVIEPMIDVRLVGIYGVGLRLRGIECVAGKEQAQEWWVRFERPMEDF